MNNIIESEDLESLELYPIEDCDRLTKDILRHILKTGDFSVYRVGVDLSIEHAKWYLHMQDGEEIEKIKDGIAKHIIKLQDQ